MDQQQNENKDLNFMTRTNALQQQQQQAFLDKVKRFKLIRSVIQHEGNLLNQRISWIILAQLFLMAAFITNTSDDGTGNTLKYITATVALLTVVVTMPVVLAAGRNIELQQKIYFARITSYEQCRKMHGHGRNLGLSWPPPLLLLLLLEFFWAPPLFLNWSRWFDFAIVLFEMRLC